MKNNPPPPRTHIFIVLCCLSGLAYCATVIKMKRKKTLLLITLLNCSFFKIMICCHMKTNKNSGAVTSVFNFVSWSAECPVMLHGVLIRTLTHVMYTCVADGEALFHDVIH